MTSEQMAEYQRNWSKTTVGRASLRASAKRYRGSPKGREFFRRKSVERRRKQRDFVRALKDVSCTDCGMRYQHYIMDFDHVKGKKEFCLSMNLANTYSRAKILEEAAKCEVVCSNCHRARTWKRAQQ